MERVATNGAARVINGFQVVERTYCHDDHFPSVGLANIHATVPGVEENKEKILRALKVFREFGVNITILPCGIVHPMNRKMPIHTWRPCYWQFRGHCPGRGGVTAGPVPVGDAV